MEIYLKAADALGKVPFLKLGVRDLEELGDGLLLSTVFADGELEALVRSSAGVGF